MNLIVKELCKLKILISLLLNNVFDAASKPKAKREKNGFILYASNSTRSPKQSGKNKTSFIIYFLL